LQINRNIGWKNIIMRKWHRWLSVFFGIFMLFIAITGVLSHWAALWPVAETAAAAPAAPPAGFECPEGWRCMPPRADTGPRSLVGFFITCIRARNLARLALPFPSCLALR
jgi:uncharacterized iron-regulated membrane protein